MLRFIILFILRLSILVCGLGFLVSHAWGWREYASPELYVVYFQLIQGKPQYFIVNADGSSPGEPLRWSDGGISTLDCSPDGRAFAFLSGSRHAYVLTRAGLDHDSPADPRYKTINVANDGTLALFDPVNTQLLVNDRTFDLSTPGEKGDAFDRVDISEQGQIVWTRDFAYIQVVSLTTGSVTPTVPHGYSGQWNTSGQMIIFADQSIDDDGVWLRGGQYIMDVTTQRVARIGDWILSSPLSPDNTKVAAAVSVRSLNNITQIEIFNVFSDQQRQLLTHDAKVASQPVCFLTFRPDSLVNGS